MFLLTFLRFLLRRFKLTDFTKAAYSSTWDIDQIFTKGEVTIPVAASTTTETVVATFDALSAPPWMDAVYKIVTGDYWFQPGVFPNPNADYEGVGLYWRTTTTSAIIGATNTTANPKEIRVRFWVYTDTIS